jgi:hypothetical protein
VILIVLDYSKEPNHFPYSLKGAISREKEETGLKLKMTTL